MKTHRNIIYIALNIVNHHVFVTFFKSWLIPSFVTLTVPMFQGCSKQAHSQDSSFTEMPPKTSVKLAVLSNSRMPIKSVDALVYNNDILQRIDCYQRFENMDYQTLMIGSGGGMKKIALCANSQWDKDEWKTADSYHNLKKMKASLEKENRNFPLMSSVITIHAGDDTTDIKMERISSIIQLNSVRCDFSGKPYEGECISDARVYLTNISGRCNIIEHDSDKIETIINHGGLINEDLKSFNDSSLIIKNIGIVNTDKSYPQAELLCYPNTVEHETAGTPFTRLVIEGKVQGERWYWPININRGAGGDHEGIKSNMTYSYDIVITRKGTKDPDAPITIEMADVVLKTETWIDKEEYFVAF